MSRGRVGTARIGLLTVLEEEFDALQPVFGHLEQIPEASRFWTPDPVSLDTVILRCPDRGNVPAAQAAASMLEQFRPEALVLMGIGGGIVRAQTQDAPQLGDVVVPDYLHYAEFLKIASGRRQKRYAAYDQPSVGLRGLHLEGVRAADGWQDAVSVERPDGSSTRPRLLIGSLVAGDKVLSDPSDELQRQIVEEHQDAVAIDMESFGVARAVHEARTSVTFNPSLLVIRGVSDLVYVDPSEAPEDNSTQRQRWKEYAAATAACAAKAVIDRITDAADERDDIRRPERASREAAAS